MSFKELQLFEMLRKGADGGCLIVLEVVNRNVLDALGVNTLHIARLVAKRPGYPSLPQYKNILWILPFSTTDYFPVRLGCYRAPVVSVSRRYV